MLSAPADDRFANGGLIYLDGEKLNTLSFDELRDPDTGRTRVRMVDTDSERYKVAREYMVQVRSEDLEDDGIVKRMADYSKRSADEIRERFGNGGS